MMINGKNVTLGYFDTEAEAANARGNAEANRTL